MELCRLSITCTLLSIQLCHFNTSMLYCFIFILLLALLHRYRCVFLVLLTTIFDVAIVAFSGVIFLFLFFTVYLLIPSVL